jgi:hypothetical protein
MILALKLYVAEHVKIILNNADAFGSYEIVYNFAFKYLDI